jgi:hypothetical protein
MATTKPLRALLFVGGLLIFAVAVGIPVAATAEEFIPEDSAEDAGPWYPDVEAEWGGHFRLRGRISWPDDKSVFALVDPDTYHDGNVEFRLKNRLDLDSWGYVETHYEAIYTGGDTRRTTNILEEFLPALSERSLIPGAPVEDDRRLMDLTSAITEGDHYITYHRLDRLHLTLLPEWGTIRMGRQAITWGNGLVFNPMDLFNPFAPTDVERDYKIGDDMVTAQFPAGDLGEVQVLYVPRRDPADHDVKWSQSSLAGKLHFALGMTEFDLMGASHYEDYVVGVGSTGYLGDTAWRMDATWTFLDEDSDSSGYASFVANMDYSWVWWKKNFYGFLEFYFNGLGEDEYSDVFTDADLIERIERGELFTVGRTYLTGLVQMEVHPLFSVYLSVINNLHDPSGIVQPRAIWNFAENFELTIGANVAYGSEDTEFGGIEIPGTNLLIKSPNSVYLWLSYYF